MVPILYQRRGLVCNHKSGRWVIEITMQQMSEKPMKVSKTFMNCFCFKYLLFGYLFFFYCQN